MLTETLEHIHSHTQAERVKDIHTDTLTYTLVQFYTHTNETEEKSKGQCIKCPQSHTIPPAMGEDHVTAMNGEMSQ